MLAIFALLIAVALATGTALGQPAQQSGATPPTISLANLPGNGPALLLFDANAGDASFQSQWDLLARSAASLSQLTVIPVLTETSVPLPASHGLKVATLNDVDAANARATFHCSGTSFCAVLLAKDGTPLQNGAGVGSKSLLQAVSPPPTQLDRAIAQQQNTVYRAMASAPARVGPSGNPFTLADLLDAARPLLIFAQSADDPDFQTQWETLTEHVLDLVGRNVVVVPVFAVSSAALPRARGLPVKTLDEVNSAKARNDFACPSAAFCVVLLDMADKTLLRAASPVSVEGIIGAIGAMPPSVPGRRN